MSDRFPTAKVERTYKFMATHALPNAGNPAAKVMHTHEYTATIIYTHEFNINDGWCFDFDKIDEKVAWLFDRLDGHCLNTILGDVPSTCEVVAGLILHSLPGWVDGVSVSESDRSKATVYRKWLTKAFTDKVQKLS